MTMLNYDTYDCTLYIDDVQIKFSIAANSKYEAQELITTKLRGIYPRTLFIYGNKDGILVSHIGYKEGEQEEKEGFYRPHNFAFSRRTTLERLLGVPVNIDKEEIIC